MADETPKRRSGRAGRPNKKYVVDPFEQYKELLAQDSDHSDRPPSVHEPMDASDDEFDAVQAAAEEAQAADEDEDAGSESDASAERAPTPAARARPAVDHEDDDEPVITPTRKVKLPKMPPTTRMVAASAKGSKPPNKKRTENLSYSALPIFDPLGNTGAKGRNIHYSRGVPEAMHTQARSERLVYALGPGEEDVIAHIQARERWLDDATVPHRKQVKGKPGGGLGYSTFYSEKKRERETNEEMAWYYEHGGRQVFASGQVFQRVDADYAQNNFVKSDDLVAGSLDEQKLVEGHEFGVAWNMAEAYSDSRGGEKHQAWVLNAGARIQALEWCPNQHGSAQYLAIATSHSSTDLDLDEDNIAPAFTPHSRRQQCLQIWEVHAKDGSESVGSEMAFTKPPRLRQVFSTDWGYIKKMRWCPTPDRQEGGRRRLGLLGVVFSDGYLRVLDMAVPNDHQQLEHIHVSKAAFESKPFETLYTCITWLSSKSIAGGTADGSVAIWNLADYIKDVPKLPQSTNTPNAHPWLYQRLHQGYIQSMASGLPSRPHLLITYSFDGFLRITDLRSPTLDTVVGQRSRIAQGPVVWHDITQSALNVDDNFTMKSYGARMFYKAISVARLTAFGADVAVSPLHASVLVGCVDGSAWVTNPMRRLRDHKAKPLVQCVLKHEWRRPVKPTSREGEDDGEAMDVDADPILSKPMIRLLTGFKINQSDMGQEGRLNATKDYVSFATVHEERTAVTQVSWNPNLIAGTWAAIGMGTGLVVVRDLAFD